MNAKDVDFKIITKEWTKITGRNHLYTNKDLSDDGIDYKKFLQLRFHSVNNNHIANEYGIEGWFLLWNLMCQAQSNQYMFLETTINTIYQKIDRKITSDNIKKILLNFNRKGIIKLNKVKSININTPIQVFISYNSNNYYNFDDDKEWKGYRALPVDFVKVVLKNVTPEEWAVFTVISVRYRYWQTVERKDDYGNVYYNLFKTHYAYPTLKQISEIIGRGKTQTSAYVERLVNNPLNIVTMFNADTMTPIYNSGKYLGNKKSNNIYYIPLFERVEYIYQNIIDQDDRPEKIKKYNQKNFTEIAMSKDYYKLKDPDYLASEFKTYINNYKKILDKNDREGYKKCDKNCTHENGMTNRVKSNQVIDIKSKSNIESENLDENPF